MRQLIRIWFVLPILILSACTLTSAPDETPPATVTLPAIPSPAPPVTLAPETAPTRVLLVSETSPYNNATYLLDGVCFDFLAAQHGQIWIWATQDDLDQFQADVDRTELCPKPAGRQTFDFAQTVLVGTTRSVTGCDAAYTVRDTVQDDVTRTVTLYVDFRVQPGCPYELVEPLVLGVPDPPTGYVLRLAIQPVP